MTVQELIDILEKIEDKTLKIYSADGREAPIGVEEHDKYVVIIYD